MLTWRAEPFTLEDMSQMPTARSARYFCPCYAKRIIDMTAHSTGYRYDREVISSLFCGQHTYHQRRLAIRIHSVPH
jgi:hypothetical protein